MAYKDYLLEKLEDLDEDWADVRPMAEPYFYALMSLANVIPDRCSLWVWQKCAAHRVDIEMDWRVDGVDWSLDLTIEEHWAYGTVTKGNVRRSIKDIQPWQLPDVMGFPRFPE